MAPLRRLLALLAALLLVPAAAAAEERILLYSSEVSVQEDGTLEVAETIRVNAEGDAIRHGIYRDFPTEYRGRMGSAVRVGFDVVEVRRDGRPEPWVTSGIGNGVRVRIGSAESFVPPGIHDYLIRYRTSRQLGFFDDYDELYWNVTGNGWAFPIDVAEARIRLPKPVQLGQRAVYTGRQGSTARDAAVVGESRGEIAFRTTRPLGPYEGLTVAVAWPKGVIAPPTAEQRLGWWLSDFAPPAVGAAGLIAILAYFFNAWRRVGRGPPAGTVVPIFSPPDGLSAAAMRYVNQMGSDNRAFAAALIQLGVSGKLRLVEGEKGFFSKAKTTIERRDASTEGLSAPEAAMLTTLFAEGDSVLMDNKNHKRFSAAQRSLSSGLKKAYEGSLFVRNVSWSLRGLGLLLVVVGVTSAATVLSLPYPPRAAAAGALLGLGAAAAAFLLYRASHGGSAVSILLKILAALLALGAFAAGIALFGIALGNGRYLPLLIPLLSLPVVISAFWWMAAPTRRGREVLDRIAGFEQYLAITEEERLAALHPPEKTPELFEKYLPYAIALGVENEWADRFAGVLAAAAAAGRTGTMAWYAGHSDPWNHPGDFVDQVGSSLSSSVASASTAPGSSSGSGGGGSSGGGGGGGGGGGW